MPFLFLEPVDLNGDGVYNRIEWEYNLNVLSKIAVTESYLAFNKKITHCQNEESFDNCTTRHYINTLTEKCGCLPFDIRMSKNIVLSIFTYNMKFNKFQSNFRLH